MRCTLQLYVSCTGSAQSESFEVLLVSVPESLGLETASDSFLVVLADLAGICLRAAVDGNISYTPPSQFNCS